MAQLFRVTKLNDSSQSQTFTFVLPSATCSEHPPEILSRDFLYAGHKWRLSLMKKDRHLSPYVQLTSSVDGMKCTTDFGFVLINRESFTQNESFSDKQKEFQCQESSHGRRTFVTLEDLNTRHFSDAKGEYLFEVNFKNPKTIFEQCFSMTPKNDQQQRSTERPTVDYQRYDTRQFQYGELEWVCVFCPNMDTTESGSRRHMLQIMRKTRLDTLCKLTYRLTLGQSDRPGRFYRTDLRHEIFDFNGDGESLYFTDDYLRFVNEKTNQIKLTLELISLTYVNQVKLNVANLLNGGRMGENKNPMVQFADKDRQNWCIILNQKSATGGESETITLSLLYPDLPNIPRNYLRFVCWSLHLLPKMSSSSNSNKTSNASVSGATTALGAPFEFYYTQLEQDRGFTIRTPLKVNELKTPGNIWLDEKDGRLTLEIEWLCSYLMLHPSYHPYDDVYRKHIAQMRREVQALQAENYSLEKELHNYQLSIANKGISIAGGAGQRATPPPRTWSSDSTNNMANSVEKCNLDDGRSSSSSNMISPSRPSAAEPTTRTPTPRSPMGLPYSINNDSHMHQQQQQQSPIRKRLPIPQQKNFKLDPVTCPQQDDDTQQHKITYNDNMQFIRRQSTPIMQPSPITPPLLSEFTPGDLRGHRLTRRVSERHTKSDRNLSFRNKGGGGIGDVHQVAPSDGASFYTADRSKSASPYPSGGGGGNNSAIYDSAQAFAYDHDRYDASYPPVVSDKQGHPAFFQRSRRGRNAGGGSFKSRNESSWTFHYNNVA